MDDLAVLVAICAVVVSVVSLWASLYFGWCTRDHNKRSVKPLPYVIAGDYENCISVLLCNNGTGPLVLRKVTARHNKEGSSGHLIDMVPESPPDVYFKNFIKVRPGRAILQGGRLDLLVFELDVDDSAAVGYRDALRDALGHISIDVEYTDIYESHFDTHTQNLTWFHRHQA